MTQRRLGQVAYGQNQMACRFWQVASLFGLAITRRRSNRNAHPPSPIARRLAVNSLAARVMRLYGAHSESGSQALQWGVAKR